MRGEVPGLGFFATPMGARPATGVRDEMGNPVYLDAGGNQFTVQQQPAPPESEWSWAGVGNALAMPWRMAAGRGTPQDTATAQGIGNALVQGFTAPGRAARGEPVTYGDAWSTALDYGVMGAPMAAPEGALRAGGMLTQSPADDVADLLRQGRAAEVTDEMMAAVDPQEIWKLYESGATGMPMPMDEASRMARAREIGFDTGTPLYHGTGEDFPAFDTARFGSREASFYGNGVYTTAMPDLASEYVTTSNSAFPIGESQNVIPMNARRPNEYVWQSDKFATRPETSQRITDMLSGAGYSGVRYPNNTVPDLLTPTEAANYEVVTFDPTNLRSRFARFDPRMSHLRNLSASLGGVAMMNALASGENQ